MNDQRLTEAEDIIRALGDLVESMYNNDLSAAWPRDANRLIEGYEERYDVTFDFPLTLT